MKKLEFLDWAMPFTVPRSLSKEETASFLAEHEIQQARYYAQFENSQDMARTCQRTALLYLPKIRKQ